MNSSMLTVLAARYLLVMLFFPFSALDKVLNFRGSVAQAAQKARRGLARVLIVTGLCIEVTMPVCILSGVADRLAGVVMAGYCVITALYWKQFWAPGDFWRGSESVGRELFWEFLKNFSLAGGFLLLAVGVHGNASSLLHHPLASSHPYAVAYP